MGTQFIFYDTEKQRKLLVSADKEILRLYGNKVISNVGWSLGEDNALSKIYNTPEGLMFLYSYYDKNGKIVHKINSPEDVKK